MVVIAVTGSRPSEIQNVGRALQALRPATDEVGIAIVVGPSDVCNAYSNLPGVDGVVTSDHVTETAAEVLLALSAYGAPETITCLDITDLFMFFGSNSGPVRLVPVTWAPMAAGGTLRVHGDEALLKSASKVWATFYLPDVKKTENRFKYQSKDLMSAVRPLIPNADFIASSVPFDYVTGVERFGLVRGVLLVAGFAV
jgi:hypothetical protein